MSHAIAIVGMGCRFPGSPDIAAYWDTIRGGHVRVRDVPGHRWHHESFYDSNPRLFDKTYAKKLGWLDDITSFAPEYFGLLPRRARLMDPQQRLFLDVCRMALEDAGYGGVFPERNTGVYLGISVSEHHQLASMRLNSWQMRDGDFGRAPPGMEEAWEFVMENAPPVQGYSMIGQMLNMAAANVSQSFDLRGPSFATDAACSSSLVALSEAILHLRARQCNAALVGGVYLAVKPDNMVAFSRIGAMSQNDICRPFDDAADGFVLGEGAGAVLLKRLEDAERDGDRIWAVVRGFGLNSDGRAEGPMTPRLAGQEDALRRAYNDAGFGPETVQYIEAHGTGTRVGDATEAGSLCTMVSDLADGPCNVKLGAVKANIGHTIAAAGVAGIIKTSLCLSQQTIPPMANFGTPRDLGLEEHGFEVPTTSAGWSSEGPRRAGVSSFGFGGTNVHVVLEEGPVRHRVRRKALAKDEPELIVLSAPTREHLIAYARRLKETFDGEMEAPLRDIAYALSRRRHMPFRAAFLAGSRAEFASYLDSVIEGASREGLFWGEERAFDFQPPPLALLFPGQGAQALDLCRALYDRFPRFRAAMERFDAQLEQAGVPGLLSSLYPAEDASRDNALASLTRTEMCQPALAAVELALISLVELDPDVLVGHSLGELVAASAAGVLTAEQTAALTVARGRVMSQLALDDTGAMSAVAADRESVASVIEGLADVGIANYNHGKQVVLSGASGAVADAETRLEAAGIKVTRLAVSHAFHSHLMDGVAEPFADYLLGVDVSPPQKTYVSCTERCVYPEDVDAIRSMWRRHAGAAVDFERAVGVAWEQGARVFVELGAGRLINMVRTVLRSQGETPTCAVPLAGDGVEVFLSSLGQLFVNGRDPSFEGLYEGRDVRLATLPPDVLATREFWLLRPPRSPKEMPAFGATTTAGGGDVLARLDALAKELSELSALVRGGDAPTPAAVTAPAPQKQKTSPLVEESVAAPEPENLQVTVMEALSRVTAIPANELSPNARLIADLGFDSLMAVELSAALVDMLPNLGELPASLLAEDLSIAELTEQVGRNLSTGGALDADSDTAGVVVSSVRWEARPAVAPTGESLPAGDVLVIDDGTGAAAALARQLEDAGKKAIVVTAEHEPNGEARDVGLIVDLHQVHGASGSLSSSMRWARYAARLKAGFVTVTGADKNGLPGLVRSLAREWPTRLVKHVELVGPWEAVDTATAIFEELTTSDAEPEVRWVAGAAAERRVPVLEPLPAVPSAALGEATILLTGATAGIGATLARGLAAPGVRLAIVGRRTAPQAEGLVRDLERAGAKVAYASCDVADPAALTAAVEACRNKLGSFTHAIHCAGVNKDEAFEDVTDESTRFVYGPKVDGALNLREALKNDTPKKVLFLGSWAGRFGSTHQATYAAANRALASIAATWSAEGKTRVSCVELPPWEGSGMVERLPAAVVASMKNVGVSFLNDASGIPCVLGELTASERPHQVLVSVGPAPAERVDEATFVLQAKDPVLADHRIDGTAVLPMAAALDHCVAASARLGMPVPVVVRGLEVVHGAAIRGDRGRLRVRAVLTGEEARIELFAREGEEREVLAYRARVAKVDESSTEVLRAPAGSRPELDLETFYKRHTFHGPSLRGVKTVDSIGDEHIAGTVTAGRGEVPRRHVDVRAIDSGLQLCGFWARERRERGALPRRIGECVVRGPIEFAAELRCTALLSGSSEDTLRGDVEFVDTDGNVQVTLRDVEAELLDRWGEQTPDVAPKDTYLVSEFQEVKELRMRIQMAEALGLANPYFHVQEDVSGETSVMEGKTYVNFASYNYLGLSGEDAINRAAAEAVQRFGTSVSASRVASGERPLHRELEERIAGYLGCEDSVVMVGGHATNVSVIGHLLGPEDVIVHDSLAHDSILGGAKLSGARRRPFAHNDMAALERLLAQVRPHARRVLIAVEGVYSMDGDIAPLPELIELKKKYKALLFVDEAHSIGVLGETGRGIGEHFGVDREDVELWMGTLSKSLASCGGYIAGSKALIEFLKYTTPGFIYSVGISPANAAAAIASFDMLEKEPQRVSLLRDRAHELLALFRARGIDTGLAQGTGVVPCIVPNSMDCLQLSEKLKGRGINVQPILYPAVEENLARLRFFVTARHTRQQLVDTADAVYEELLAINPKHLATPQPSVRSAL